MLVGRDRGFDASEFQFRLARAQERMSAAKIDGLLLTSPDNIRYFTGLECNLDESYTRPWFLIVPAKGDPLAIVPAIGEELIRETWIRTIESWPSPRPQDEGTSLVVRALNTLPRRHGRVGAEFGSELRLGMPVDQLNDIVHGLSGVQLVDAASLVWSLRMIKSDAEVGKIQTAIDIAGAIYGQVPDFVHVGDTERFISQQFRARLASGGADSVRSLICRSGPGGPIGITGAPRDRPLAEGDLLFIDTGSTFNAYFCDYDRNYQVGDALDAMLFAHDRVWAANDVGIKAAVPGATAGSIFEQMAKALSSDNCDLNSNGRMGHGLGLRVTEPPSVRLEDETVLEPGMVLCIEPCLEYEPGKIILHEEIVMITPDGCRLLTERAPKQLPRIG